MVWLAKTLPRSVERLGAKNRSALTPAATRGWLIPFSVIAILAGAGCDRSPPEPAAPIENSVSPVAPSAEPSGSATGDARATCIVSLAATAPEPATSLEACPADPAGIPSMPRGKVRFPQATSGRAPELDVELAQNGEHRSHGLMFRPSLSETEGMLFSWASDAPRSFWMRNTCLALDMLFIAGDGTIVGILEQVPPWNEAPRRIGCPAAHVLEVQSGWARAHGVRPGQKIEIQANLSPQE